MLILSLLFTLFIEIFTCIDFYSSFATKKMRNIPVFLIVSLLYFIHGFSALILNEIAFNIIISVVINFLSSFICYVCGLKKSIFGALFLTTVMTITEFFSLSLFSFINNVTFGSNEYLVSAIENEETYFIFSVFGKLLYFVIVKSLSYRLSEKKMYPVFLFIFPICTLLTLYIFYTVLSQYEVTATLKILITFAVSFLIVSVFLSYIFFIKHTNKIQKANTLQIKKEKTDTESSYYKLLNKQNDEMKKFIHDEKNHLAAIKSIAQNAQVDKYIESLYKEIESYSVIGDTHNIILDLIINKYEHICSENKIEFDTYIKTANLSFISEPDLIALLGNILDNAVEAAEKSDTKKIEFSLNKKNGFDVLICNNSSAYHPILQGENFVTTKNESGYHGVGISIIKKVAAKYNGVFEWSFDEANKEFTIYIAFNSNDSKNI